MACYPICCLKQINREEKILVNNTYLTSRNNYFYFRLFTLKMSDTKDESEMDIDDVMFSFERDVLGGEDKEHRDEVSEVNSETSFKGGGSEGSKVGHGAIEVNWEGKAYTIDSIGQGDDGDETQMAHDITSVTIANTKPLHISPYLSIISKLNEIAISRKLTFHPVPTVFKPPFPFAAPKKAVANSNDGGLAIVNCIPICNPLQPEFFTSNDKKAGCTVELGFFKCNSTYSISFDLMRKCRVCRFDHNVFPKENSGALIIGDSYTPSTVGGFDRCIPVFRLNNPSFEDCATSLKYILRNRTDQNGKSLAGPRIIIISLPSLLGAVGPEQYLAEFKAFKNWIQHFLTSGDDINPRDSRISRPYNGPIEVFEGFALFKQDDFGLSQSYAVLSRSMNILNAVDPVQNPGFLYNAHAELMEEICLNPPPKEDLIRFIAIPPVKQEFNVYEKGLLFPGVQEDNLDNTIIKSLVYSRFYRNITVKLHERYVKLGLENELVTLPRLEDFSEPLTTRPQADLDSQEFLNVLPFNGCEDINPRVVIIGHSIMSKLSKSLETVLDSELVFVKCPLKLKSSMIEIKAFFDNQDLTENDTLVLGMYGNSLLQGTVKQRYNAPKPSGEPENFQIENGKNGGVFYPLNAAGYDPIYMNLFGDHLTNIMKILTPRNIKVCVITPLPRYYQRCCDKAGHFDPYFNAGDFNAEILRLGVFLSRLPCMKNTLCITPEDICSRDSWMSRGDMLQHDLVHLTPRGLILLRNLTHRGIIYLNSNTNPKLGSTGDCTIPKSLNFAQWVVEFRENCGYDTLVASSLAKRTHPVAVAKSSKKK